MAGDYCTITEVKDALPDGSWGTSYDTLLTVLVSRASRLIDSLLKRSPGSFAVGSDSVFYFDGSGERELWISELAAAPTTVEVAETGVLTEYTAWANSDFYPWPYNAIAQGSPYLRLDIDDLNGSKSIWPAYSKAVKITGPFGFSVEPPDEIQQAAIIQTARWFKRGQQAFQDSGAIIELGQIKYLGKLDPDIAAILEIPRFQLIMGD